MASHQVALLLAHLRLRLWDLLDRLLHLLLHHHRLLTGSRRVSIHAWMARVGHGASSALIVALGRTALAHRLALGPVLVASLRTAWMASHGARLLLHQIGHGLEEHLEVELELLLVGQIGPFGALRVLLAELLEVVLVARGLILELTDLLDLVVVDGQ